MDLNGRSVCVNSGWEHNRTNDIRYILMEDCFIRFVSETCSWYVYSVATCGLSVGYSCKCS